MKRRKIGKVISLCLAAVILATSQGSMFKEERTPDGHWVDGAGARKE